MHVVDTEWDTPYLLKQNADRRYLHFLILVQEFIPEKGILFGKMVGFLKGRSKLSWKREGIRANKMVRN